MISRTTRDALGLGGAGLLALTLITTTLGDGGGRAGPDGPRAESASPLAAKQLRVTGVYDESRQAMEGAQLDVIPEAGTPMAMATADGRTFRAKLPGTSRKATILLDHPALEGRSEIPLDSDPTTEVELLIVDGKVIAKVLPDAAAMAATAATAGGADACAEAWPIFGDGTWTFDTTLATTDGLMPASCPQPNNDVWFCWTADCDATVTVDTCGGTALDTVVAVYAVCGTCPPGEPLLLACNDDFCGLQSAVTFAAVGGASYLIRIGSFSPSQTGAGTFRVSSGPSCFDDCADALPIMGEGVFDFHNGNATMDGPAELCGSINHDVWYCWTATCTGTMVLSTCGLTTIDTMVAVYDGCGSCGALPPALACNDDTCGLQSQVLFNAVAGNQYLLRIGTYIASPGGSGQFELACLQPPENDLCADAIALPAPAIVEGTTSFATVDSEAPGCGTALVTSPGVWYTVMGTGRTLTASLCPYVESDCCFANGTPGCDDPVCEALVCACDPFCCDVIWDSLCVTGGCGSAALCAGICTPEPAADWDTKISVFCDGCDGLTCVDGNDDFCGLQSEVSWCSKEGAIYHVLVHGFGGASGDFVLQIDESGPDCVPTVDCIVDCNNNGVPDDLEVLPEYDPLHAVPADGCLAAQFIGVGIPYVGWTTPATNDANVFCDLLYAGAYDVYYRYRPAADGVAVFNVCDHAFDQVASSGDHIELTFGLNGLQHVPPVDTPATGRGCLTLDPSSLLLTWEIEYANLSGHATGAGFHHAPYGFVGPDVGVPVTPTIVDDGSGNGWISGAAYIGVAQATDLLNGDWYLSIATAAYPAGELRGQVYPGECANDNVAVISIHDGCPATDANMLACNFASSVGQNCGAIVPVQAGETYWIRIAGESDTRGWYQLIVDGPRELLNPADINENGLVDECECLGDVNQDGYVDGYDFNQVYYMMGETCVGCVEDINLDGIVDEQDLQLVLLDWGPCHYW